MSIDRLRFGPFTRIATLGQSRGLVPFVGGLLGLIAFAGGLGLPLANPTRYQWLLDGDWAIHFMGWHLYRGGPWTIPIGATPNLGSPIGTSVALTDSIPVFAALFKLFNPVLPPIFQYIGLWLLLCYVLQGVFGALLMRVLTPRPSLQVLGAGLIVMSPPQILRFGHPALSAHWLLLAALWLYLKRDPETSTASSQLAAWTLIVGIAAATHPYLALMVLILAAAAYARCAVRRLSTLLVATGCLVLLGAVAGLVLWQSGYFIVSEQGLRVGGFGTYSMNLLAPLIPLGMSRVFGTGPFAYAAPAQWEGYAYMGAGMLLLTPVALGRLAMGIRRLRWERRYWQHLPFALACVLFVVMALSPVVTAGSRTLFEYDGRWLGPLTTFRASGRMFWPVFYALTLAILFAVARLRLAVSLTLFTAALALQMIDLSDTYRGMRPLRDRAFTDKLQSPFWLVVPPYYDHLMLIPTNICAPNAQVDFLPFTLLAGRHRQTINAGLAARYDSRAVTDYCEAFHADLKRGAVNRSTLYVLQPQLVRGFQAAAQAPTVCAIVDGFGVCTIAGEYLAWQDAWDILMRSLPPLDEFVRFYHVLENDYRDTLKRPPFATRSSADERAAAIVRYLGYRLDGCLHQEATEKTLRQLRGERELRICRNMAQRQQPLPAANETFAFRRQLESLYANRSGSPSVSSYIDPEGEAVWLQEYLRHRLSGRGHTEATEVVLGAVRKAAAVPQ
jgi:hypothetical protein